MIDTAKEVHKSPSGTIDEELNNVSPFIKFMKIYNRIEIEQGLND